MKRNIKAYWKKLREYVQSNFKKNTLNMTFLARVVNMQDKLEQIFGEPPSYLSFNKLNYIKMGSIEPSKYTLGLKYNDMKKNLWNNVYLAEIYRFMDKEGLTYEQIDMKERPLQDANLLFADKLQNQSFYKNVKRLKNQDVPDTFVNHVYFENIQERGEVPLPTFARMTKNCLYLSQILITDSHALALKKFLEASKGLKSNFVKKLYIDDCGMRDEQFTQIL